jgi:hypothetical protein
MKLIHQNYEKSKTWPKEYCMQKLKINKDDILALYR